VFPVQKSNLIVEAKSFYASNSSCITILFFLLFSWNGNRATYVLKVAQVKNLTWEPKSGLVEPLVKCIINEIPTYGISLPLHICSTISTMPPFVHST